MADDMAGADTTNFGPVRHPARADTPVGRRQRPPRPTSRRHGRRSTPTRGSTTIRLRIGFVLIAMVLSVFGVRLLQLQAIDADEYAAMAAAEGTREIVVPATRGSILDRNGMPLAQSVDGMMLIANPQLTTADAPAIARLLSAKLGLDYFDTLGRLRESDSQFQYLARRVPASQARAVATALDSAGYTGVDVSRDPVRSYPATDVAANLLGFLGSDGTPLAGVERAFNDYLSGSDGSATYAVSSEGQRIPLGTSETITPVNGRNLRLTIDRDVQWYTQRVLAQAVEGSGGESGVAVVMDSRSGELLALADYPTFDANEATEAPKADLGTRSLFDVYEPGSVQKVLTAAALLDAGKVTPTTRISVPGQLPRQDRVIGDYWDHGRLRLTLTGVIAKSSNIGTVLAADQFEPEEFHEYLRSFGLGQRQNLGIPGESAGILPGADEWSALRQATISFGQGISVNAVQMAAAVNAVANGGLRIPPTLIKGVAPTDGGQEVGSARVTGEQVISERAAELTARMMESVTDPDEGTAPLAGIDGYRVAGKTGTAQRVGEDCGCYDGTVTVSFAGFAPADDPRFLTYVVVHSPSNGGGGGTIGGPAFKKIMSFLLQKYAVPPTGRTSKQFPLSW